MSEQNQSEPSQANRQNELDDIPVDELIRMTRQFTRRITNQDRQRLGLELRETGHQRDIQLSAPVTLQQFFSGEIDLDTDLARRFSNAPLLSSSKFFPRHGQPIKRQAMGIFSSNDDSAMLSVDAHINDNATIDFTFTMFSALATRFRLDRLSAGERKRWLDLMRRANGITFLWTEKRWEAPHLIFVVREYYGRVYAFSPHGPQAAARLTPDMILDLIDWLEDLWFPDRRAERIRKAAEEQQRADDFVETVPLGDFIESPTHMRRPTRRRPHLRDAIPDAPEEQWADEPAQEALEWAASDDFSADDVPATAFDNTPAANPDDDFSDDFTDDLGGGLADDLGGDFADDPDPSLGGDLNGEDLDW